ncbi:Aste57867_9395 [Aphanomyces stellatus]|uniref:Aste57867_9395 protein n=1 Tax=Aphanomyces stellatus TaxID=120398 RepID=A0A485KMN9_9STRA|nr:hypothetical protein As57867_009359 [Aphanomyces stellatus]VFT86275.1 Aste57867_9395 [Aphanomyces stellatus]
MQGPSFLIACLALSSVVAARCPIPSCLEILNPVCGNNNQTYSNLCLLNQAACDDSTLRLNSYGACETSKCVLGCFEILDSVCGSNGVTYDNQCFLEHAACLDNSIEQVDCDTY